LAIEEGNELMNALTQLSPKQLRRAADLQERVLALQDEVNAILGGPAEATATGAPRKRKVSAAARAKMRKAQRERWASTRGEAAVAAMVKPEPKAKGKKKLSAQGIANIRAGVARRMAKQMATAVVVGAGNSGVTIKAAILKALAGGGMSRPALAARVNVLRGQKTKPASFKGALKEMKGKDKSITNPRIGFWRLR
jgi:hypothetical protein